jgi:hypothetical protein
MQTSLDSYVSTLQMLKDEFPSSASSSKQAAVLGFVGHSSAAHWSMEYLEDKILNPYLQEAGQPPAKVMMPTDGTTSILVQAWADKQKFNSLPVEADWRTLGPKARAYRDGKICKESTHLIFFGGLRSDTYEKMAIRELKKGKRVFLFDAETKEFQELVT